MKASSLLIVLVLTGFVGGPALAEETGQALYEAHCLTCHQADGRGVPRMQPPIKGSEIVIGNADTLVAYTFLGSGEDPGNWANAMPGFQQLSDADLAALLTYVRESFGTGGVVTEQSVAEIRQQFFGSD